MDKTSLNSLIKKITITIKTIKISYNNRINWKKLMINKNNFNKKKTYKIINKPLYLIKYNQNVMKNHKGHQKKSKKSIFFFIIFRIKKIRDLKRKNDHYRKVLK